MLYIIVPVHNRIASTKRFLGSLYKQDHRDFRLVIVDDGSNDNTCEFITANYPEVILVSGSGNLFWGGGINAGLKAIEPLIEKTDMVAFANNDIEFRNDTITQLTRSINKHDEFTLFHALVTDHDGICVSSGSRLINWPFFITKHPFRGKNVSEIESAREVRIDFTTARFLIFRAEVLDYMKYIDTDRFIHYAGDYDFSYTLSKHNIFTYISTGSICILNTETSDYNPENIKSFAGFVKSLTNIKSSNNLKVISRFGQKHCPALFFPFYFMSLFTKIAVQNLIK